MLSKGPWLGGASGPFGVLLAILACLAAMLAFGKPAHAEVVRYYDTQVNVPGNSHRDVDTFVELRPGDRVVVSASGEINPGCLFCTGVKPGGSGEAPDGWPLPGAPEYSLLGKSGGQYFYIGSGKTWTHQGGSDRLYLYVNDIWTGDNSGAFQANIRVERDVPLPETSITSGPAGSARSLDLRDGPIPVPIGPSATFGFSGSSPEHGVTFECSLDDASFVPCSSPKTYTNLWVGQHTFEVRAVDRFRRRDPTPATRTWIAGNLPPEIRAAKPTGKIHDRTPLIMAVVRDAHTDLTQGNIEFFLDGRAKAFDYNPATGQLSYQSSRLARGSHTVRVNATDGVLGSSKSWNFKVTRKR